MFEPTKQDIKELYDECNQMYFWGRLGKCDFMFFSRNVGFLGWYNSREDKNGKPKDRIWIGTCFRKHRRRIKRDFGIDIMAFHDLKYRSKKVAPPKLWEKVLTWLIDR